MPRLPDRSLAAAALAVGLAAGISVVASGDDAPSSAVAAAGTSSTGSDATRTPATSRSDAGGTTTAAPSSGAYADGTYEASGSYRSPAGEESVSVSLTVAGDRVTAVKVTPQAREGSSKAFQERFAGGVSQVVVGRPLDALQVGAVAGSSLTGGGFDEAVERIRAEAAS